MNGVEILAVEEIGTAFGLDETKFWIMIMAGLVIGIITGGIAALAENDLKNLLTGLIVGAVMGILGGLIVGFADGTPTEFETQYKVTISDDVFMNEFNEKYEIIEQEGKIYTVRERREATNE